MSLAIASRKPVVVEAADGHASGQRLDPAEVVDVPVRGDEMIDPGHAGVRRRRAMRLGVSLPRPARVDEDRLPRRRHDEGGRAPFDVDPVDVQPASRHRRPATEAAPARRRRAPSRVKASRATTSELGARRIRRPSGPRCGWDDPVPCCAARRSRSGRTSLPRASPGSRMCAGTVMPRKIRSRRRSSPPPCPPSALGISIFSRAPKFLMRWISVSSATGEGLALVVAHLEAPLGAVEGQAVALDRHEGVERIAHGRARRVLHDRVHGVGDVDVLLEDAAVAEVAVRGLASSRRGPRGAGSS